MAALDVAGWSQINSVKCAWCVGVAWIGFVASLNIAAEWDLEMFVVIKWFAG